MKTPLNGAQRVVSGGMSDYNNDIIEVGEITEDVAKYAGIEPGKIILTKNYIKHIGKGHLGQLQKLGFTPSKYVKWIATRYNSIYNGSEDSLLLTIYNRNKKLAHTAAIRLHYYTLSGVWVVKTAFPRGVSRLEKEKPLWSIWDKKIKG